jgi:hypothetical protein
MINKTIKHVDGKTDVIAIGIVKNNEFIGEYKYKGMTYGVTFELKRYVCGYCGNEVDENNNPIKMEDLPSNPEKVEGTCCILKERLGSFWIKYGKMKELRNTIQGADLVDARRSGNTTRQIDYAVSLLFMGFKIIVMDHHLMGRDDMSNARLFRLIMNRLQTEHHIISEKRVIYDVKELTIELIEYNCLKGWGIKLVQRLKKWNTEKFLTKGQVKGK